MSTPTTQHFLQEMGSRKMEITKAKSKKATSTITGEPTQPSVQVTKSKSAKSTASKPKTGKSMHTMPRTSSQSSATSSSDSASEVSICWTEAKIISLINVHFEKKREMGTTKYNKQKADIWHYIVEMLRKDKLFEDDVVNKEPVRMKYNKLMSKYRSYRDLLSISGGERATIPKPLTPEIVELIDSAMRDSDAVNPKTTAEIGTLPTEISQHNTTEKKKRKASAAGDETLNEQLKIRKEQLDKLINIEERKAAAFEKLIECMSNK